MTSDSSARRGPTRLPANFRRSLPEIRWQSCLSPVHPKGFRISADYPLVRGGMPVMETKNFGQISFEPDSELEFPSGLPGFDSRRRFVAVRFAKSDPLIHRSEEHTSELQSLTMPILAVDPL